MYNICKKIFFLLLIIFQLPANAHVQHYENLNRIEFHIYRNSNHIGKHVFSFNRSGENMTVKSEIDFVIKKFGIVLYRYKASGTETYENGNLVKFKSVTLQNKKKKYVNINLRDDSYNIDGSSYKGKAPTEYMIGTWWNHSIVNAKAQISAVSGRIIKQNVKFLGKESIKINGKTFKTLHFNFSSTEKKSDKDKKLNTDVWYDENTLNWVKASFNKKGKWEYKLISID